MYCTLTATSSPVVVLALKTCARLAAAIGVVSKDSNISVGDLPKSSLKSLTTSSAPRVRHLSWRAFNVWMYSLGKM